MMTREQARRVIEFLRKPGNIAVGSFRRKAARMKDVDVLVLDPTQFDNILDRTGDAIAESRRRSGYPYVQVQKFQGGDKHRQYRGIFHDTDRGAHYPVLIDIFYYDPKYKAFATLAFSGSAEYVMHMRAHAKRRGFLLDQYGLFRVNDTSAGKIRVTLPEGLTEREILDRIGFEYKPPPQR